MSDFENPYKSPETSIVPENNQNTGTVLTETMLGYLKGASPWLRFIGIVGFIGTGFMCLSGISLAVTSSTITDLTEGYINFPVWLLLLIYFGAGALFFFPAYFTFNFGAKIRNYQFSGSDKDLEAAFKNNKSLCKFQGILLIVYLSLIPVLIIALIIVAMTAAFNVFSIY